MIEKIKEMSKEERPREKLIKKGPESLTDSELLAIILKTGTKNRNVLEVSKEIIKKYESISKLKNISISDLSKIKGIGPVKAVELCATFEIAKRMIHQEITKITCADDAYYYLRSKMSFLPQEELHVLFLNNKKHLISSQMLFRGSVNSSNVYPHDIFREALKNNATGIILAHNHPSGDVTPSKDDIEFTKAMKKIGKTIGLVVIDHIIIGYNTYYSFYDSKWWDDNEL